MSRNGEDNDRMAIFEPVLRLARIYYRGLSRLR